jgi:uncharacterized membrane protein
MKTNETGTVFEASQSPSDSSRGAACLPTRKDRAHAVDALRGLVMIIMALDHTREFFHAGAMSFQPEDLTRTTAAVFFTRWITHICAPVFFFTTGLGAFFWLARGHTESRTSYLVKRGLWLVLLELTALRFATNFSLRNGPVLLTILWALGWSMVALGFLSRLPVRPLAIGSILVIVLHDLADPITAGSLGAAGPLWNVLHQPGVIRVDGSILIVAYPLVPWIAVAAAGFCFGPVMSLDPSARRVWMVRMGLGMIFAFVALRTVNVYGDPRPWSSEIAGKTVLSFLRCTKYPPSLDFLLMTLGPALLLLAWFDRRDLSPTPLSRNNLLLVFGRVPLFYFLLHFLLIHVLTIPLAYSRYGKVGFLLNPLPSIGGKSDAYPPDYGHGLGVVYGVWIVVLVIMYPLCLWFCRLKQRRRDWWLSYV